MNSVIVFFLIVSTLHGVGTWKLYKSASYNPYIAFIPVLNILILLRIINRPKWWVFLMLIPVINVIIIPVIWVEISRSFGKNSYSHTFLSLVSLGFYNYYLNYFTKLEYIKNRSTKPRSTNGEWTSSIIFAVIAATLVHTYFIQPYTIPTSSLEKSLLVGDFLFVSKFHYGARVPMTPIAAPMVHDTLPIIKVKSYINKNQLPIIAELPYLRFPGIQKIKRNEIVCFNWPVDTNLNMFYTDKSYYKPIDKKTNYVKRAVGIAGDTLEIIDGYVYINGKKNVLPDRAKLQFSYLVQPKKYRFTSNDMIKNYDITDGFGIPQTINGSKNLNNTYYFAGISESSASKLKNHPNVSSVKRNIEEKGVRGNNIFPHDKSYNWNSDFYGPIYIPKKNSSIPINKSNISVYKRLIEVYENNKLEIDGDRIIINDKEISEYKFKQDYYWLMGDNRGNSQDSRAWGFVPFDHVVGKPIFKWLSIDYNAKGLDKIRWERMFTSVHGKGVPTSYFPHFIIIIILYYLFSFLYKKYKK